MFSSSPGCQRMPEGSRDVENPRPRFLADAMLGRLARWLRILGYDTQYVKDVPDSEVIRLARAEGRVILTRDRELCRRRGVRAIWIASTAVGEQVREVVNALGLSAGTRFRRCVVCNAELEEIPREEARRLVPTYVFRTQKKFGRCPSCGRVYWRGTHWRRMAEQLQELGV